MATLRTGYDPRAVRWIRVRVGVVGVLVAGCFAAVAARAVQLQVLQQDKLGRLARDQYVREIELMPRRGVITDRSGTPLAENADADSIFADPVELTRDVSADGAAKKLAKPLGLDWRPLARKLDKGGRFLWVKRRVSPAEADAVRKLDLPGVAFARESRRYYPQRELAGHLIGFVGSDGNGLDGVERAFDDALQGEAMRVPSLRDARGMELFDDGVGPDRVLEGARVELTIDKALQWRAEQALQKALQTSHALSAMAVAIDPRTGEVLALANEPPVNPNVLKKPEELRDRALVDAFEPGSTMKTFSISAALEEKVLKPGDALFAENGAYKIGRDTVHDHKGFGWIGPSKVVAASSNIGASKIAERLGREKLARYYALFGFGEKPGTGLPGEAKGVVPMPRADIQLATMSFGQGMTASPLQITTAMAAIAAGGMLMKPWLVKRVVDPATGRVLSESTPTPVRRVVSREVAATMTRWLEGVLTDPDGTGKKAKVEGYRVAGKTGTAQKADPVSGGYSADKRFSSFVGFLPAQAPRIVIGVFVDEPKGDVYGGDVAAPAFREIADFAMKQLAVLPTEPIAAAKGAPAEPAPAPAAAPPPAPEVELADVDAAPAPHKGGGVTVPSLAGLPARAALKALEAADLAADLTGTGRVSAQQPRPGELVARGTRVKLTLAPPAG